MPVLKSKYHPPWIFRNGHFSTLYSAILRPVPKLLQKRERITLLDGDFMDIDWSYALKSQNKVAILLHGLEGNSQRTYIKGMASHLVKNYWDVAAVNYRGCSGEINRNYPSYTSGKTDDLEEIISQILEKDIYNEIVLVGFSLGGNLLLKYLGERQIVPSQIKMGIAVSAPLSLKGSLVSLSRSENWMYRTQFLRSLKRKYKEKMTFYPEKITMNNYRNIRSLLDFDNIYTAPAHGFKDAEDYYRKNSSAQFLPEIKIPVLLMNAKNDSFLSPQCYPLTLASQSKSFYLEMPEYGGHVGFYLSNREYYNERKAIDFLNH